MRWIALSAVLMAALAGCNASTDPAADAGLQSADAKPAVATSADPASMAKLAPPAQAVYQFLDAVRKGDDNEATKMLSSVARQKASQMDRSVRPPASDTAKFQVGSVEYLNDEAARVSSLWTDLDENGEAQTDEALWVLRKEAEGWRVAGVAATVFDGEPPLLLNFEDPEEMVQKQEWVREEIQRRAGGEPLQAMGPTESGPPIRR